MQSYQYLAFDYGHKRIGVATGTTVLRQAQALTTLAATGCETTIAKLIAEWQPDALIVGLPVHMDGTEHKTTKEARKFAKWLGKRFAKPVHLVDERLTTRTAQAILEDRGMEARKARTIRDSVAAQVILQAYLDELPT